jgi:hypothetical protein
VEALEAVSCSRNNSAKYRQRQSHLVENKYEQRSLNYIFQVYPSIREIVHLHVVVVVPVIKISKSTLTNSSIIQQLQYLTIINKKAVRQVKVQMKPNTSQDNTFRKCDSISPMIIICTNVVQSRKCRLLL